MALAAQDQVSFAYDEIESAEVRDFLASKERVIRSHSRKVVESVCAIGAELKEVKDSVAHGLWLRWVAHCNIPPSTAENYINVSEKWSANSRVVQSCDMTALYVLSTSRVPDAVRDDLRKLVGAKNLASHERINRKTAIALRDAAPELRGRYAEGMLSREEFVGIHEQVQKLPADSPEATIANCLITDPKIVPFLPMMPDVEKVVMINTGYWQGGEKPIAVSELTIRDLQYAERLNPENQPEPAEPAESTPALLDAEFVCVDVKGAHVQLEADGDLSKLLESGKAYRIKFYEA